MRSELRPALVMMLAMTLITGIAYPLLVTGIARLAFPTKAQGSLIRVEGRAVGSRLIGQEFSDPRYFWGRLSATSPGPYDASASSGSNLGPSNPALLVAARARIAALRSADPGAPARVPVDLVTASASGLDPDISLAAAEFQVARVARARSRSLEDVRQLVRRASTGRGFGLLGEPVVNVLELNLALDHARAGEVR